MGRLTDVVKHLLIINVIVFVAFFVLFPQFKDMLNLFFPKSIHFQPLQLVSHMFMHGSFGHIFFNMFSLFFLGPMVEQALGSRRFLIFYLLCGFGSMLLHLGIEWYNYMSVIDHLAVDFDTINTEGRSVISSGKNYVDAASAKMNQVLNIPVVGASGAIMGIFIAFGLMFPNMKLMVFPLPIPIKAKFLMVGAVAFDLFSGVSGFSTGIAHFAHLGGAITGFILIMMWKKSTLFR